MIHAHGSSLEPLRGASALEGANLEGYCIAVDDPGQIPGGHCADPCARPIESKRATTTCASVARPATILGAALGARDTMSFPRGVMISQAMPEPSPTGIRVMTSSSIAPSVVSG